MENNRQDPSSRTAQRPFRFGVSAWTGNSRSEWVNKAKKVEDLGYSTLVVGDHLVGDGLTPLPAAMSAADATSALRIGSLVFCNDFRHPLLLAREALALDVLSDGRFELGMGWVGRR